jgi:extracellular matrix regulatory protein B
MYVHLGGDTVVPINEIIGIFDSRLIEQSPDNKRFMEIARSQGRMRAEVPAGEQKSVIVTTGGVYTSAISSLTLTRRVTNVQWGLGGSEGLLKPPDQQP